MKHTFKEGDAFEPSCKARAIEFLKMADQLGYNVFNLNVDNEPLIEYWYCNGELGFIACCRAEPNYTEKEMFDFLTNTKSENMKHEFNEGDGVFTSCKEETQKLLQLAHEKGYKVFEGSMTATNHTGFRFSKGRFTGARKETITNRIAKSCFISLMNETQVETPKPTIPMINKSDIIIIPAELQREMFAAATISQMPFLDKHINLKTGAITKGGMMEIYNVACHSWQEKLAKEWDWLKIKPLTIVYGEKTDNIKLFSDGVLNAMIQTYIMDDEFKDKAFLLNDMYNWKIVKNSYGHSVLVPERK